MEGAGRLAGEEEGRTEVHRVRYEAGEAKVADRVREEAGLGGADHRTGRLLLEYICSGGVFNIFLSDHYCVQYKTQVFSHHEKS